MQSPQDWARGVDSDVANARLRAEAAQLSSASAAASAAQAMDAVARHVKESDGRDHGIDLKLDALSTRVRALEAQNEAIIVAVKTIGPRVAKWVAVVAIPALISAMGTSLWSSQASTDTSIQRIAAARSEDEAAQKRLFAQALAEGRADRDAELEAARIAELRRQAAAERAANMRE